jgi:hypothetical protein
LSLSWMCIRFDKASRTMVIAQLYILVDEGEHLPETSGAPQFESSNHSFL